MSLRPRRTGTRLAHALLTPAALLLVMLISFTPGAVFGQEATPEMTEAAPAEPETPAEAATPAVEPDIALPARVVGSGVAAPLFNALAAAAGSDAVVEVTGTTTGFAEFCANAAAITLATRAITPAEAELCAINGVAFQEVLIAHSAAALIANPQAEFVECLATFDLAPLFSLSATAANWTEVAPENPDLPLTIALPPANSAAYAVFDALLDGDGLRADTAPLADETAVVAAVAADRGTLGLVGLEAALNAGDSVKRIDLDFGEAGCAAPNAANIEGRTYAAAQPILAYRNLLAAAGRNVIAFALSDAAAPVISGANFSVPTVETLAAQNADFANDTAGRLYTRVETTYSIPPNLSGVIEIAGAAAGSTYVNDLTTAFSSSYAGVTANAAFEGGIAGARRFCNGEVDLITTSAPLTQEQLDNCAANNVTPYPVTLGNQAVVIVRNAGDTFAQCLTLAQLTTIFGVASNATVTNWNQVDASYPDVPLFAFVSELGDSSVNQLLLTAAGSNDPGRADLQVNADPLYRAAAVGATSGLIAVYAWNDYQTAAGEQANIALVQIDGGSGCIEPTETTIADGSYPLSTPVNLVINRASFIKPQVQALIWFLFSDANYVSLQSAGFVGVRFGDLPELRANLQETFEQVSIEAQQAALSQAEATPEATSPAEAETTPEATAESP
ncbi:MAG: substrate-binding domain-containing protein [bacterium]|nr:substrate-binding domain-containing protein [bacterium]